MPKKGKNKKAAAEPEVEIDPDLKELTIPNVKDRIDALQYRLSKAAKDRNYMQLEKDMVNRFYEITKSEVKQIEAELLNMDRKMEILERDFRVHIKVHEQKVQNLEYEHKEAKRQVNDTGNNDLQKEREMHSEQLLQMNKEKLDLKRDIRETQLENEGQVKMLIQGFAKRLQNLRDTFEQNHQQLQAQYEEQVEQLKIDLELRRKVEIHEIEERKNQHINELLFNHQEAFDEIKAYYNDITHDNLQLIKSLKDEINEMKEKEKTNKKKMDLLRQENRDLTQPLEDKLEEQRVLEEELKTYTKDKMALKNLKAHYKRLEEQISEAKQEYRACEDKFRKMEKERDDLYKRFKKAVQEIQRKPLNIMNCLLLCLARAGQKCRLGKEAGDLVSAVRRETSTALRGLEQCQVGPQHRGQRHQEVGAGPWCQESADQGSAVPGAPSHQAIQRHHPRLREQTAIPGRGTGGDWLRGDSDGHIAHASASGHKGELRPGQVALCFQRCPKSLGGAPNSPRNPENAWDTSNLSSKNTLNQHSLCVFLCFLMKYMGISRYIPCGRYGISKSASNFSPTNRSWEGKTGNMAGFHPVLALLQRFHGGVAAKHRDRR